MLASVCVLAKIMCNPTNATLGKTVSYMIDSHVPTMSSQKCNIFDAKTNSQTTRCNVYKTINPQYKVHDVYVKIQVINDIHGISFTRFRVCGHRLAVETGRWNRRGRGRLSLNERLCVCGYRQNM